MSTLGRYKLLHRLGVGGMAEVFLARATGESDFARQVVVKRMLPQLAADPAAVEMFLDEARLGSRLHHPHIVPVLDLGRADGEYFMVLEFVDGIDLGTLALRARAVGQPLPHALTAWIIARAADGLHAAHEARDPETGAALAIVHRDVSPSNILLSRSGEVRVADFGVARSATQANHTNHGALKGKVAYMSPEQLLGVPLDARSDVFALGTVLWQLLTRKRRHESRNELAIMQATVQEDAPAPSTIARDVPPELDAIVLHMLERERDHRTASMKDVARALDRFAWSQGLMGRGALEAWLDEHRPLLEQPAPGLELSPLSFSTPPPAATQIVDRLAATRADVVPLTVARWPQLERRLVRRCAQVSSRLVDGQAIVVTQSSRHTLNDSATFIWELVDGVRTLGDIADELPRAFELTPDIAREEVLAFVEQAMSQGMLALD